MVNLAANDNITLTLPRIGTIKCVPKGNSSTQNLKDVRVRIIGKSKSTPNAFVSQLSRKPSRILLEDFWSGRMKAEVRNLENNKDGLQKRKSKTLNKIPEIGKELSKRFMRNRLTRLSVNSTKVSTLGLVPALDKIISDCDHEIRTSRRLSGENSLRDQILTRRLSTYSKTIFA